MIKVEYQNKKPSLQEKMELTELALANVGELQFILTKEQ